MTRRRALTFGGVLAVTLAAGALFLPLGRTHDALALGPDGVGPLRLGLAYEEAVAAAHRAAPRTAFAGLGCNGFDEVRYSGEFAALPVSVMGMAVGGGLSQVEITVDAPLRARDEPACTALLDSFAAPFIARFGPAEKSWVEQKPVSREHLLQVGPALLAARWFPTGQSCYVSALYGVRTLEVAF